MWAERIAYIVDTYHNGLAAPAARRAGIAEQTVTRVLRGEGAPSADALAALSLSHPTVSPEWLLTGRGPREREAEPLTGRTAVKEVLDAVERLVAELRTRFGV